jgi:hypothetical protein
VLGVVLAGILSHPRPWEPVLVLRTIDELFNQHLLRISDPIKEIFNLTESTTLEEDFDELATKIETTVRACFYILHVIEPLWARKLRIQEVTQIDVDKCRQNFRTNNHLYN